MTEQELDLVPLDELVGAMHRRFDAIAVVTLTQETTGLEAFSLMTHGSRFRLFGALTIAAKRVAETL